MVGKPTILGPGTLVPIGLVVTCALGLFGFTGWIDSKFKRVYDKLDTTTASIMTEQARVTALESSVAVARANRWTAQDMEIYVLSLRINNPAIKSPDVAEIISHRQQDIKAQP